MLAHCAEFGQYVCTTTSMAGPKTIFRRSCVAFGSLALTFMELYVRLRSLKSFLCEKFSRSTESGNGRLF